MTGHLGGADVPRVTANDLVKWMGRRPGKRWEDAIHAIETAVQCIQSERALAEHRAALNPYSAPPEQ